MTFYVHKRMSLQYPFINFKSENSFAYRTFTLRFPAIIQQIIDGNQFDNETNNQLKLLIEELSVLAVQVIEHSDDDLWDSFYQKHLNKKLIGLPFFDAEIYLYALINQIVNFKNASADPFYKVKLADILKSKSEFESILDQRPNKNWSIKEHLYFSLNGNKSDLSQLYLKPNQLDLLIDDADSLIEQIEKSSLVHIFMDNAGMELFADLLLVDHLVTHFPLKVILHVKSEPLFVSDTMSVDIAILLDQLKEWQQTEIPDAIHKHRHDQKVEIYSSLFWNAPLHFNQLTESILSQISPSDMIISKGDANYRRFFEDREIPFDTPVSDLTQYLPCPTFALRTLKSEIQLGLSQQQITQLNETDPAWLVNGKYAVVQQLK